MDLSKFISDHHSEVSTGVNIVSILGTGVASIAGTACANSILKSSNEVKEQLELLRNGDVELPESIEYSDADYKKDISENRVNVAKKMVVAYFPAALLAVGGIANTVCSYVHKVK